MFNYGLRLFPSSPRPSQFPYLLGTIVGICGLLVSLYFGYQNHQAEKWPMVTGYCLSSQRDGARTQSARMLSYSYNVEGKAYAIQRFQAAISSDTPQTIAIAYDPNNPGYGVVKTDAPVLLIMGIVFFAVLGLWSFFSYVGGETIDVGANSNWHY
jgi:Protein of unknown function (DUF3592)